MGSNRRRRRLALAGWLAVGILLVVRSVSAHPMGNFSISHYAGIRIGGDAVEIRYLLDLAEIPTFQEIQEAGIVPETGHLSVLEYLPRKIEVLRNGLTVEINGRRLELRAETSEAMFSPGAGGLPTLKIGIVFRARLDGIGSAGLHDLRYRDENFADRAGWKEVVAAEGPGVTFASSSVPDQDRSRQLTDYPTDLLSSPPQTLEARVIFSREGAPPALATAIPQRPAPPKAAPVKKASEMASENGETERGTKRALPSAEVEAGAQQVVEPVRLEANRQGTPRSAFTELVATRQLEFGVVLIALVAAAGLGAFHALEPGHGKTVVAAYLVGSRGTAWHAVWLGVIVTVSHTAGVYLLGFVTLYASRYVVPERLYPWLGVASGLTVAALGILLFLRRYAGATHAHTHAHAHGHHHHHEGTAHRHAWADDHGHHHPKADATVSLSELLALGVTGGIVPCPAALVVLLSAVSLHRVGFGLVLIVAFSVGLAAVLIAIGLLMVYARRFMSRFHAEGPLITRWLPLTSSAVIALLGVGIAIQALTGAGIIQIRL